MARVRILRTISLQATPTALVHYRAGWEGTAPRAHIARLVAAGAGERLPPHPGLKD